MSPATSAQVRRRQAARRDALERQQRLNEERRRRDEVEIELAADFTLALEERIAAREAMEAAELAMGRVVERMIGELRVRYPRAAQLLEIPEDELRRLRQLATDSARDSASARDADSGGGTIGERPSAGGRSETAGLPRRGRGRSRREPTSPHEIADGAQLSTPGTESPVDDADREGSPESTAGAAVPR